MTFDCFYAINIIDVYQGVIALKCPFCGFEESKVIDSRPTDEGERIRRRRECMSCGKRFTTYEIIETVPIVVVKRTNRVRSLTETSFSTVCSRRVKSAPSIWNSSKRLSAR